MQFRCEDLKDAGVVLIPHDSPDFAPLLADITHHIESPPPGGPPPLPDDTTVLPDPADPVSAILWNRSGKAICAYTLVWNPGVVSTNGVGQFPSLLLPFGLPEERRAFETYWHTILPNSKRWVNRETQLGSNADIRPPEGAEIWKGGVMRFGGAGYARPRQQPDTVTLKIDAVFFATGECVGPNTKQLWEQVVSRAEVAQQIAAAAGTGVEQGLAADRILTSVEQITGKSRRSDDPGPPYFRHVDPHEFPEYARQQFAEWIYGMRRRSGDVRTVAILANWSNAAMPAYRRIL